MECSCVLVFDCLLGGLLLLLLLLSLTFIFTFSRSSFLYWRGSFFFLFFLLNSNKQANNVLRLDHVVLINLKLVEDIVNFGLGHLVSPGHEGMGEHLGVNLAIDSISHEGLNNEVIRVISIPCHLLLEHGDHVVRSAATANLTQQAVPMFLRHEDTNIVESSPEVIFVDHAILVDIHQLEAVLVHLDLLLREALWCFILTLAHVESCLSPCET